MRTHIGLIVPARRRHSLNAMCPSASLYILQAGLLNEGMSSEVIDFTGYGFSQDEPEAPEKMLDGGLWGWTGRLSCGLSGFSFPRYSPKASSAPVPEDAYPDDCIQKILKSSMSVAVFYIEDRHDCREAAVLSARLRRHKPDIHQTLMGPHAESYGQLLLSDCPGFDSVVTGVPCQTLVLLGDCLKEGDAWNEIPGILCRGTDDALVRRRRNSRVESHFSAHRLEHILFNKTDTSLPADCFGLFPVSFSCIPTPLSSRKGSADLSRLKEPERLLAEMQFLHRYYDASLFHVDTAGAHASHLDRFAKTVLASDAVMVYSLGNLTTVFDTSIAERLFASGCRSLGFNVPTGSQRLLDDYYGHTISIGAMRATVRQCRAAGLFTAVRLCYPCPQDDYHTRAETELFLESCRPDAVIVSLPVLTPNSLWYDHAQDYGFSIDHRQFRRWASGACRARRKPPYRMRGRHMGRVFQERDGLEIIARALGCIIGVSEQEGLLACLSRSVIAEHQFLEQLKSALEEGNRQQLGRLMAYVRMSLPQPCSLAGAPAAAAPPSLVAYAD